MLDVQNIFHHTKYILISFLHKHFEEVCISGAFLLTWVDSTEKDPPVFYWNLIRFGWHLPGSKHRKRKGMIAFSPNWAAFVWHFHPSTVPGLLNPRDSLTLSRELNYSNLLLKWKWKIFLAVESQRGRESGNVIHFKSVFFSRPLLSQVTSALGVCLSTNHIGSQFLSDFVL